MTDPLLYNLFAAFRKEDRLVKSGIAEYLILQKLVSNQKGVNNFEDFVFACEMLLAKTKAEKLVCRHILNDWRQEVEKFIQAQYAAVEKIKNPETLAKTEVPGAMDAPKLTPAESQLPTDLATQQSTQSESPVLKQDAEKTSDGQTPGDDEEARMTFTLSDESPETASGARKFHPGNTNSPGDPKKNFFFGTEYFPVSNRYLRQNWRSLKNRQRIRQFASIDILATIDTIARTGLFTEFQYQQRNQNLLALFVFIDRGSSMSSTEAFGRELAESAKQSGTHLEVEPFYFYDSPEPANGDDTDYFLLNEDETESYTTSFLFKNLSKKNIVTLVYGDCGALGVLRNESAQTREYNLANFMRYLVKNTAYTAWLNPAPKHRWQNTPAAKLNAAMPELPMFEANNTGVDQAINALKGKMIISK